MKSIEKMYIRKKIRCPNESKFNFFRHLKEIEKIYKKQIGNIFYDE